jgi:hypothetical protein
MGSRKATEIVTFHNTREALALGDPLDVYIIARLEKPTEAYNLSGLKPAQAWNPDLPDQARRSNSHLLKLPKLWGRKVFLLAYPISDLNGIIAIRAPGALNPQDRARPGPNQGYPTEALICGVENLGHPHLLT